MIKVAMVLSTSGLEYDDRIRKEILSLQSSGEVSFKIFAKVDQNKAESGITSYGVPYELIYLKTRKWLPSSKGLLFKLLELYLRVRPRLRGYDVLWCADEAMFPFIWLARFKTKIWDLHELPELLMMRNRWTKRFFHHLEKKCSMIIHANHFRLDYLVEKGVIKYPEKHAVINNYPDRSLLDSSEKPPFTLELDTWLNGEKYVYLQGLNIPGRYPYNSIAAILKSTDLKLVIVGRRITEDVETALRRDFGDEVMDSRCYFTGMVKQMQTPYLIKNSFTTLIFYRTSAPNARFCEANRFYQALMLGLPVICGGNPPLREIVDRYQCGVALESDGSNLDEICEALRRLMADYDKMKHNSEQLGDRFIWNDEKILELIKPVLCK